MVYSCYRLMYLLWLSGVYGVVILIGQDGVQRPPIRFPTTGSLLSFLNCLENGLHPNGELDPPLFNPRSKGLGLPRLKRPPSGDNILLSALSKGDNQDYVFRLVSGTKPEDLGMQFFYFQEEKKCSKCSFWFELAQNKTYISVKQQFNHLCWEGKATLFALIISRKFQIW